MRGLYTIFLLQRKILFYISKFLLLKKYLVFNWLSIFNYIILAFFYVK